MLDNVFEEASIVLFVNVLVLSVEITSLPPNVAVVASKFATKVPVVTVKFPVEAPVAVVVPIVNLSALSSNPINALSESPLSIMIPESLAGVPVVPLPNSNSVSEATVLVVDIVVVVPLTVKSPVTVKALLTVNVLFASLIVLFVNVSVDDAVI